MINLANRSHFRLKIFILIFTLFCLLYITQYKVNANENDFTGGNGTENSPYIIETAEQLDKIRENLQAHYKLGNNIDLKNWENGEDDTGWVPIGRYQNEPFTGTFNGNGHTISNLTIDRPNGSYQGLFSFVDEGHIKQLILENVDVTGSSNVGGLVGVVRNNKSTVSHVTVSGNVHGEGSSVGGLIGQSAARIDYAHSSVNVTAKGTNVGGLVGSNTHIVVYSSASGTVFSPNYSVGGLVGKNSHSRFNGVIAYSYATGDVTGRTDTGGLVGENETYASISHSYATGNVFGTIEDINYTGTGGLVGRNENLIKNTYATGDVTSGSEVGGLVGDNGVGEAIIDSYSVGKVTANTTVNTHLQGGLVGKNLMSDIIRSYSDINTSGQTEGAGYDQRFDPKPEKIMYNTVEMKQKFPGWDFDYVWRHTNGEYHTLRFDNLGTPLEGDGTKENPYKVKTADDLNWVRVDVTAHFQLENDITLNENDEWEPLGSVYLPFMGHFDGNGHTVKNININREKSEGVGFFGVTVYAVIENTHLENVNVHGKYNIGGLIGVAANSIVTNSSVQGNVVGKLESELGYKLRGKGGLIGTVLTGTSIENSYSLGTVNGYNEVGGLIGYIDENSTIDKSYSLSDVSGTMNLGGLVGHMEYAKISDSYARGKVTGTEGVGAFVGFSYPRRENQPSKVINSYVTGEVSSSSTGGGFISSMSNREYLHVIHSFSDKESTKAETARPTDSVIQETTENMKKRDTFTTDPIKWDFDMIWDIDPNINDGYPHLRWQTGSVPTLPEKELEEIYFTKTEYILEENDEKSVVVTAKFNDDSEQTMTSQMTYMIENNSIATIDNDGKVKGVKQGTTKLVAEYMGKTAETNIVVKIAENNGDKTPPSPGNTGGSGGSSGTDRPGVNPGEPTIPEEPDPEPITPIEVDLDKEIGVKSGDTIILETENMKTTVTMPSNLPEGTIFKIRDAKEQEPVANAKNLHLIGPVFNFTLILSDGEDELEDFVLVFPYDRENSNPNNIDVYYYDELLGQWIAQDGEVDELNGTITIKVNHFSIYGVFELVEEKERIIFTDITDPNADHYEAIMYLTENGIINGYDNGTFNQWGNAYRGQMAKMITNALDLELVSEAEIESILNIYDDVNKETDYADFIATVTKAGVFKGTPVKNSDKYRFGTYDFINREQMASVLVRAFELNKIEIIYKKINLNNVSKDHQQNVQILANLEITDELNDYRPTEEISRGALSSFLYRVIMQVD